MTQIENIDLFKKCFLKQLKQYPCEMGFISKSDVSRAFDQAIKIYKEKNNEQDTRN